MFTLLILGALCISLIKPAPFNENSRYEIDIIVLQPEQYSKGDSKAIKIILKRSKQPVDKGQTQVNVDVTAKRSKVFARHNKQAYLTCKVETNEKSQDVQIKWFAELVEHKTSEWRIMPQASYKSSETGTHAFKTTLGVKKRRGLYRFKCQACLIKANTGNDCDEAVVTLKVNNK